MRNLKETTQLRKDFKKAVKSGKKLDTLILILDSLAAERPLDPKYLDHPLRGDYAGCRECHLSPDWLLIYQIDRGDVKLIRTGSHSELFD